jgi:nucleolar protein 15
MPAISKQKKGLSAASLLDKSKGTEKELKTSAKKRTRVEDETEAKNTFEALAPTKKFKKADSSASADDEKTLASALFKAPAGLPTRVTDNKKVGPQPAAFTGDKKKKKSTGKSVVDSESDSDSSLIGYPSSLPSTPQESSDFSFGSDFSETDDGEGSSVDEFANNTLEIKLDQDTTDRLKKKLKGTKTLDHEIRKELAAGEGKQNLAVIYLSHIPFGFYEEQMKSFFNQFGTVTRLRLSRAKRSGRSRGYAFIEFDDPEVASIVAETMNDYLMYGRRLKCEVVPKEKVHPSTFLGSGRVRPDTTAQSHQTHRLAHNRTKTQQEMDKNVRRLLEREEKRRKKIEALGLQYEFDGFSSQAPAAALPDVSKLEKSSKTSKTSKH